MKFEEVRPGLLRIEYATVEQLGVSEQQELLARLEEKRGRVVIVFEVGAAVRSVPMEVPTFWLGVTARPELQLAGMAIVTKSSAVRVAAQGFALANVARGVATRVSSFESVSAAETWGLALLEEK